MFRKSILMLGLTLAIASCQSESSSKHEHGHGNPAEATKSLTLDHGKRWPTDESLRTGMTAIRRHLQDDLKGIHAGTHSADDYQALAAKIEKEVGSVVANCKLPKDADAQLHLVLAQVSAGTARMKKDGDRMAGAVSVVQALEAYAKFFDHPGFEPPKH